MIDTIDRQLIAYGVRRTERKVVLEIGAHDLGIAEVILARGCRAITPSNCAPTPILEPMLAPTRMDMTCLFTVAPVGAKVFPESRVSPVTSVFVIWAVALTTPSIYVMTYDITSSTTLHT